MRWKAFWPVAVRANEQTSKSVIVQAIGKCRLSACVYHNVAKHDDDDDDDGKGSKHREPDRAEKHMVYLCTLFCVCVSLTACEWRKFRFVGNGAKRYAHTIASIMYRSCDVHMAHCNCIREKGSHTRSLSLSHSFNAPSVHVFDLTL